MSDTTYPTILAHVDSLESSIMHPDLPSNGEEAAEFAQFAGNGVFEDDGLYGQDYKARYGRCEDAPCCGCCGPYGDDVSEYDDEPDCYPEDDEDADDYDDDEPWDGFRDDVEADADTLASAGYGTDEDYGYFGDSSYED